MLVYSYTEYCLNRSRGSLLILRENNRVLKLLSFGISKQQSLVRTRRVSLEYVSASANQFRDGSAANSANLPFFSELSCFWARRASQDTKKGNPVTLIALLHITDNWYGRKNVAESKQRPKRDFCTCAEQLTPESNCSSSGFYNLWEKRMKDCRGAPSFLHQFLYQLDISNGETRIPEYRKDYRSGAQEF